jgi:hypothetical protein
MCFARKPGLGHYQGSREEWRKVYRAARVAARIGSDPDRKLNGIAWKAELIVSYERDDHNDYLTIPVGARLEAKRLIDEIINE